MANTLHESVVAVRTELLALHKSLLDAERAELERVEGALTPGQFLQLLIQDPRFVWLRPISELIVQMDEDVATARKANASLDATQAAPLLNSVGTLLGAAPDSSDFATRYAVLRAKDPAIEAAHARIVALLATR